MSILRERLFEIEAIPDAAIDTSDIPERDETFFAAARLVMPPSDGEKAVPPRVDENVLD